MMTEIEAGRVNCCICKDLSRLGREFIETGRYLRRIFPAYGVRFVAITDRIDTLSDNGDDLTVGLKSIMNDAYCRDVSIKTRSALEAKRAGGDYVGACCVYGYRKSEENHNLLVPDEYAAKVICDIFDMKLSGHSAARIADSLNASGILSPYQYKKDRGLPHPKKNFCDKEDAKWSAHTIIRILQDETYIGTLIQGKTATPNYKLKEVQKKPQSEWHRKENAHEAIISKADFDLVQRLMRLDTRTSPDGDKVYVFSGLLICGCCGNRMIRKSAPGNGKRYYNYWCPTTKKGGCTRSGMMKEEDLLSCVLDSVKAHIANVASLETLISTLDSGRIGRDLADKLAEQVAENERRLDKIRAFKSGLYENMIEGNLSKEEHKALKAKYTADADCACGA
jgi:DNA invertase Pin-like site-specific DNA recombinase